MVDRKTCSWCRGVGMYRRRPVKNGEWWWLNGGHLIVLVMTMTGDWDSEESCSIMSGSNIYYEPLGSMWGKNRP
jgi:hypothetical protein